MPPLFDSIRDFALSFPGAREDYPFGPADTVYKAANGKMFAICNEDGQGVLHVTLKLTPDEGGAALLFPFVSVARYVGRYGWLTAHATSEPELDLALEWVRRSHELVTAKGARRR